MAQAARKTARKRRRPSDETEFEREAETMRQGRGHATQETFNDLMKVFREVYRDGASPQVTDAVTQALLTVLGSGPAFAALETLVSASQANGLMYANQVAVQQQTNIHAMTTLTRCVNALLHIDSEWAEEELAENAPNVL